MEITEKSKGDVWYIYDGECPLCRTAALSLRIREAVGRLHLINAREETDHPVMHEINAQALNIDEGTVIKFGGNFYHGGDAMVVMALLGSKTGWFNRMNAILFSNRRFAKFCYPAIRAGRNCLLWMKGVGQIENLKQKYSDDNPIFQSIFGEDWERMPPVMHKHYAIRANSRDVVTVEGTLDVDANLPVRMAGKLFGILVPASGKDVPVTVTFTSGISSHTFNFDRAFHYPDRKPYHFRSSMVPVGGNELIEVMRFGFGWRCAYDWDGEKVILSHRGYVWRISGRDIPMPFHLLIGKGYAEEIPLSDDTFSMWTHTKHPLFGETFRYSGIFRVIDNE